MKGPDFELPPLELPPPPARPSDAPPAGPARRRGAVLVGLLAVLGVGVAAGTYWATNHAGGAGPAPVTVPSTVTTMARPATSTSTVLTTTTTTALTRVNVRTCNDEAGEPQPLQSRSAGVAGSPITLQFSPRVANDALVTIGTALSEARNALGESGAIEVIVHCDLEQYVTASNRPPEEIRQNLTDGLVAQILRGNIWIYGPNFDRPGVTQRRVVYHEYFHAVQRYASRNRTTQSTGNPLWLVEGSARYFEYTVVPQDQDSFRRTQIRRWSALPTLADLEQSGGGVTVGGGGEAYTVGAVACDYLVSTYGRDKLQHGVWEAMAHTDWRTAFAEVFGRTVDDFYAEFELYRQTLRP